MSARGAGQVLVLLAMAVLAWPASGRAQVASELRIAVGPAWDVHSDLLSTPFRQTGSGFTGVLEYARSHFSLSLRGGVAETSSGPEIPREGGREDVWSGALKVRYMKDAGEVAGLSLGWGLGLGAESVFRRHHYPAYRVETSELFGDLWIPLSGVGALRWTSEAGTALEERLEVGLLMGIFASPFAGAKYFPSGSLAGIWDTRLLEHRLALSHPLSDRLSFRMEHRARFVDTRRERTLRSLQQELMAGVGIRLGGGGR